MKIAAHDDRVSMTAETAVVTRTKVYPSKAHPGPAWKWVYTVAIPGEPYTFSGDTLSWVRDLCRRKLHRPRILFMWKENARKEGT